MLHCVVQFCCVIRVLIIQSSRIAFYWELRGHFVHLCDIITVLGAFRLQIDFISASRFTRALSYGFLTVGVNISRLSGKRKVGGVEEFLMSSPYHASRIKRYGIFLAQKEIGILQMVDNLT